MSEGAASTAAAPVADDTKKSGWFSRLAKAVGEGFDYVAGIDDPDDLETVDDGAGETAADAEEDAGFNGERKALWKQLRGMMGADIMSLFSVPVFIMEPLSCTQKMAEIMQFAEILDEAADEEDEDLRLARVCALAISTYSSNERTKKPFNPILGETFECVLEKTGGVYLSEQVSHHPPCGAGHAATDKWTYDITSMVKTKFMGNWVDVWPLGRTRIRLNRSRDVYNICPPPSRINNMLVGRMWIDTFGEMSVNNLATGGSALVKFKECGFFGKGRWEVSGDVLGADGEVKYQLKGHWNHSVTAVKPAARCEGEGAGDGDGDEGGEEIVLWTKEAMPKDRDKYGFTHFARHCNSAAGCPPGLLASDARLRPDRAALEAGDLNP